MIIIIINILFICIHYSELGDLDLAVSRWLKELVGVNSAVHERRSYTRSELVMSS